MFSTRDLSGFVSSAVEVLKLKFVHNVGQLGEGGVVIKPEFTHQVFGEKENVFGYQNLRIMLYYSPDHLDLCVHITYDDAVSMETHGMKPDNILNALNEWLPKGYCTSLDTFSLVLSQQRPFVPPDHQLHSYTAHDGTLCHIYKASLSLPGFKDYLSRLQPLLLWFIEAASYIDGEDDKWQFYIVYRLDQVAGVAQHSLVAFASVYMFFHYPNCQRPRISQMLVLPQYQRQGHGAQLLQEVWSDLSLDPATYDITVEEPTTSFTRLRDFVDCRNALQLPVFQSPSVHRPFRGDLLTATTETLKLHKTQARRVYEILRLRATDRSNSDQYKDYRLAVKNRLNAPHQREVQVHSRLSRLMDPVELSLAHSPPSVSVEEHLTTLHEAYLQLETEYRTVIERLAAS